jgi:arginine kinase
MREITEQHNFGYRGTHGENFEVKDGVFDISNIRRIGMSEFELIQEITKGIQELIETEQTFESKKK